MPNARMVPGRPGRRTAGVGCAVAGLALLACGDAATPLGRTGPAEAGPRAGVYSVGEFVFSNTCVVPPFSLSGTRAVVRTAQFDLRPETDTAGVVELTGALQIPDPTPGAPPIAIFEGPETGRYRIAGDTLRLLFFNPPNDWVSVIRFTRFHGGVIAGTSTSACRSMGLRLEGR